LHPTRIPSAPNRGDDHGDPQDDFREDDRGQEGRRPDEGAAAASAAPAANSESKSATKSGLPSMADLGKLVEKFKLPGIDVNAIVESQRKDMEALAEANRQAYEGIKALAQRRNEILQERWCSGRSAMKDATGKDALSKRAEMAKQGVQQAIANFRELAEMEAQSRSKAWKVLQDRFQENVANLQKLLQAEVTRRGRCID
jgi:phasin family protein